MHTREPPNGPVCDFCMKPKVTHSFDPSDMTAASDTFDTQYGPVVYIPSASAWAACSRCATIIERGDVETLANVAAEGTLRRMGIPSLPYEVEDYARVLKHQYSELLPVLGSKRRPSKKDIEQHEAGPRLESFNRPPDVESN